MSWYRSGTIAVTNGSTAVVGTSTAFIANVAIGEGLLAPDGKVYEITAVTSDTGLTLGSAYLGSNSSGQTYAIIPSQSYVRDLATQAATLVNSYQSVKDNAGSGKFGDGTVGSPGVQFLSDSDTGIRRTGANAIALVTGGADWVTLGSDGATTILANSASAALRVTQTGAGNAFVVEDSASTDASPFMIDTAGLVGMGRYTPSERMHFANTLAIAWDGTSAYAAGTSGSKIFSYSDNALYFDNYVGNFIFRGAAYAERMRIDNAGNVGIGGTASAGQTLVLNKNATGATTSTQLVMSGAFQSDVTTLANLSRTYAQTAGTAFTIPGLVHFNTQQGSFGSTTVTSQYGFIASVGLTGATNNYGFTSNIPAGTNRYNFYAGGTADNYFAGAVGIGATPSATSKLYVGASTTSTSSNEYGSYVYNLASNTSGAVNKYGVYGIAYADTGYGGSGSVVGIMGLSKQNAAVSVSNSLFGLQSQLISSFAGTIGSAAGLYITHAHTTSAVTNVYGVQIPSFAGSSTTSAYGVQVGDITGATNAFGFHSAVANAANHYNFYASGSAPNYFNGSVQSDAQIHAHGATAIPAGGTAGAGFRLSSTANFGVFFGSGAPTLSAAKGSLYLRSDGSTTNDRMYVNTNGSTTWTAVTTAA